MSRSTTLPYPVELYAPIILTLIELLALVPGLETMCLGLQLMNNVQVREWCGSQACLAWPVPWGSH